MGRTVAAALSDLGSSFLKHILLWAGVWSAYVGQKLQEGTSLNIKHAPSKRLLSIRLEGHLKAPTPSHGRLGDSTAEVTPFIFLHIGTKAPDRRCHQADPALTRLHLRSPVHVHLQAVSRHRRWQGWTLRIRKRCREFNVKTPSINSRRVHIFPFSLFEFLFMCVKFIWRWLFEQSEEEGFL